MVGAILQLVFGCLFGAILLRSGASDFDTMERMFLFEDTHLFALAGVTTLVAALGLFLLLRSSWALGIRAMPRSVHRGSVAGGLMFGLGWGLSGACPGTVLTQLGAGHVVALATLVGVLLGNWLFTRVNLRRFGISPDSCS
jgi:uncharacterized protein